jgi:holo-[acyl-carrier protein] synthase
VDEEAGVIASALELLEIDEVARLPAAERTAVFSERERAYAAARSDPERRLAARLAAKRAAVRVLGGGLEPADVEVTRARGGPPALALSERARARLQALGGARLLVSLTHGRTHAAASVLLTRG